VATTLVVMAAGVGSRFGGMKQVAEMGPSGEALFDYAVYDALRSGFGGVVFVVSEASAGAVEAHVAAGCGRHVEIRYALQKSDGRAKPFGTGHAVLTACAEVDGSFGVVNADDFYGLESFRVLGRGLAGGSSDHVLVGFRLRESLSANGGVSRGVCEVDGGFLASIVELHDVAVEGDGVRNAEGVALTGGELISTNLWGFRPSFCRALAEGFDAFLTAHGADPKAEFLIGDAVTSLAGRGEKVRVVPTTERFLGVTYAADTAGVRAEIADLVSAGQYPTPLWP
jgi:hypothetical protein